LRIPGLSAEAQLLDDRSISFNIGRSKIVEQTATTTYESQKTHTGMMVLVMDLEVLGKFLDPFRQKGDLYFG
jgi:hypothetical protein